MRRKNTIVCYNFIKFESIKQQPISNRSYYKLKQNYAVFLTTLFVEKLPYLVEDLRICGSKLGIFYRDNKQNRRQNDMILVSGWS